MIIADVEDIRTEILSLLSTSELNNYDRKVLLDTLQLIDSVIRDYYLSQIETLKACWRASPDQT